ncbi:dihydrodipicolinate synthase family protein [Salinibacter grassmerensis]|uniref:dihydrodipicolinate synthase family protein n=1 Tax=Salinibacter grassmerensis TaxID=3040353 RepID=UPI0021E8D743|nr:dihydrodipicolinate synthase family protein [Salinibacter grassmerensis]
MSPRLPSGVLAAGLTPFHADQSLAHDSFAAHTQWLLDHGCDAVLLFGTTGEGLSLSVSERLAGLDAVLASGIPARRLLVGTGASALPDAVELTRKATQEGAGGVLVLPPVHFRQVSPEGLFRFYDRLIQAVGDPGLQLYFYHFPELSGVPIPFSVIEELRGAYPDQIAGVKDSSGEWDHTEALCRHFSDLQVFSGTERLLLRVLEAGGAGCISATANVTAALAAKVLRRWRENEAPGSVQDTLSTFRTAFASLPTIPALKFLLSRRLDAPDWATVRPPLAPLADTERKAVEDIADRLEEEVHLPGSGAQPT